MKAETNPHENARDHWPLEHNDIWQALCDLKNRMHTIISSMPDTHLPSEETTMQWIRTSLSHLPHADLRFIQRKTLHYVCCREQIMLDTRCAGAITRQHKKYLRVHMQQAGTPYGILLHINRTGIRLYRISLAPQPFEARHHMATTQPYDHRLRTSLTIQGLLHSSPTRPQPLHTSNAVSVSKISLHYQQLLQHSQQRQQKKTHWINDQLTPWSSPQAGADTWLVARNWQALQHDPVGAFRYLPDTIKTPALCRRVVKIDGLLLAYVPDIYKTDSLCALAIRQQPLALIHVPDQIKTVTFCLSHLDSQLMQQHPMLLAELPAILQTHARCRQALQQDVRVLGILPSWAHTRDLYLLAIRHANSLDDLYEHLPESALRDPLVRQLALRRCPDLIEYIPETLHSPELWQDLFQHSQRLDLLPAAERSAQRCTQAVAVNGDELQYVPVTLRSPERCLSAVRQNGNALEYVPPKLRTAACCMLAVQQNPEAMAHVPDEHKNHALCQQAIQADPHCLRHIPPRQQTPTLLHTLLLQQPAGLFRYLPMSIKKQQQQAIKALQSGMANSLDDIPPVTRTTRVCQQAVLQEAHNLAHVPDKHKTHALCQQAVQAEPHCLRHVPVHMLWLELCQQAVCDDAHTLRYLPEPWARKVTEEAIKNDVQALYGLYFHNNPNASSPHSRSKRRNSHRD